ncbi:hypothetical protein D4Z93_02785 [Clostridium fermenticellae]|uniref:Uncharacterized protein n=1 Tax=Clostridium fermenticellae TaxID=2068654 RepID=A0A386H1U9_9CLOT|nr:permease prefix domain 1-containing protein [Clostridium fermenticellae]AYD39523.1 hypothetical protein D4Z93_02785 [Clostridium fermenticellae]
MSKIDMYVDHICSNFNQSDKDIQILKEELKSNLKDEISELQNQGFSEQESLKITLSNFGEEKKFISEMNSIWTRKSEFTLKIIKAAIAIFIIGCIFVIVRLLFNGSSLIFQNFASLLFNISWIVGCIAFYQYINIENKSISLFIIFLCDIIFSTFFITCILFPNSIKDNFIIIFGIVLITVLIMKIYFIKNKLQNQD